MSLRNSLNSIRDYIKGLEEGSYGNVIKLFSDDALVHSSLYGDVQAKTFYKDLFSDTSSSQISLKNIFFSSDSPKTAAAHFVYNWTLKDGTPVPFECVDIFIFNESNKIQELTIIHDTYNTRQAFEKVQKNS